MPSAERILERALKLDPAARADYLRRACGKDEALRADVASLLEAHERHPEMLQRPSPQAAPIGAVAETHIGPYRVLSELGRGGMGVVLLAEDPKLERLVAIKALPEWLRHDSTRIERLREEARLLAAMDHPTVATVHALQEHAGSDYLVMEYVPGPTLAERLTAGPLPLEECLRVGRDIAMALEGAHRRGVAHLDIKPENIVLSSNGRVKVLDFGLAMATARRDGRRIAAPRQAKSRAAGRRSSRSPGSNRAIREIRGTPGFMSPEQLRGRPGDHRSDLFSFGALLYECCAGQPAFGGRTPEERIAATRLCAPRWDRLPPSLPASIAQTLRSCLEKDPARRLADASSARRALEEEIGRRSAGVSPPEWPEAAAPTNLPAALDRFVGRVAERRALRADVESGRLVTLTGAGGSGKTRLALECARDLLEGPGRFRDALRDGIWLVELAPLSNLAAAIEGIAATLGIRERRGLSLRAALRQHLATRRMLLLLDNCEHLPAGFAALVTQLLAGAAELRVLATSRTPLGCPGEHLVHVAPLAVPVRGESRDSRPAAARLLRCPSVALFVDRARAADPSFRLTRAAGRAVAEICRQLDGVPLAIELAARRTGALSVELIAARIDSLFRPSARRTPLEQRRRTLDGLIEWSHRLLSPAERVFFQRLSVFSGSFTLEAAEEVCTGGGLEPWQALDLLLELAQKSLVEPAPAVRRRAREDAPEQPRFRMLEIVRRYARERLGRSREAAAVSRRHRDYFAALARQAGARLRGPDQALWFERLESQADDLRAALEWSARSGDPGPALSMAASLGVFWSVRGRWSEGQRILALLLAADEAAGAEERWARGRMGARIWAGNLALHQGDMAGAQAGYEGALRVAGGLGDGGGRARALQNLGVVAIFRGELDRAERLLLEAMPIQKKARDLAEQAVIYLNLGVVAERKGDLARAAALYKRSLILRRRMRDRFSTCLSLNNLGVVEEKRGRLRQALAIHRRTLRLRRRLGDRRGVAESLYNLAAVLLRRGRQAAATRAFVQSLRLRRELHDELGVLASLEAIASAGAERNPERSAALLAYCDAARRRLAVPPSLAGREERRRIRGVLESRLATRALRRAAERGRSLGAEEAVALVARKGTR